jgi:hypothetical protein
MDDELILEKANTFVMCCEMVMKSDFGNSSILLPKPMEDLIFNLIQNFKFFFVSELVEYFFTDTGLELIRLVFWYTFLYMLGENEMQEKKSNPRNVLGIDFYMKYK